MSSCRLAVRAVPLALVLFAGIAAGAGRAAGEGGHTVLVVGDSLAHGLAAGLEIVLAPAPGEVRHAEVEALIDIGMGLIPRGGDDVVTMLQRRLAQGRVPDAIVLHLGTNDVGMPLGGGPFYGEGWHRRYGERLRALADVAAATGVPVVWAEVPAIHNRRFAETIDVHIRPRQRAVLDDPDSGVLYVGTLAITGDDGAYRASRFGQRAPRFRAGDGIHFTGYGYAFVADHVVAAIEAATGLALRPAPPRPEAPPVPAASASAAGAGADAGPPRDVPGPRADEESQADAPNVRTDQTPRSEDPGTDADPEPVGPAAPGPEAGAEPRREGSGSRGGQASLPDTSDLHGDR